MGVAPLKPENLRRAYVELNRIKQAVTNSRGRPLTHKQAERILELWRAQRRVLKDAGKG